MYAVEAFENANDTSIFWHQKPLEHDRKKIFLRSVIQLLARHIKIRYLNHPIERFGRRVRSIGIYPCKFGIPNCTYWSWPSRIEQLIYY
ncbi:unnamed protein product [Haemonchus placei]|uniref:Transposase n=1 Tax=Haemonchus placei TaxID=6290 RepID=A0A158QN90_HAEPC|nr:unnamed protein product [Haemonchus placei]